MASIKVSALPAASSVDSADLLYVVQGGVSKKGTLLTVQSYIQNSLGDMATQDSGNVSITGGTISASTLEASAFARVSSSTNQLILGTTNTVTINATAPSASRVYSIRDVLANATFALATSGNNCFFTTTGATNVTLPTSGTLCTTVGSASITTVGTITTGTWTATPINGAYINYNTTNLQVTANQLNTIQNIATTSSPTFAGLNTPSITGPTQIAFHIGGVGPDVATITSSGLLMVSGGMTTLNSGLSQQSTNPSFYTTFVINEAQTANRALNFVLGDASRTITLAGNPTLSDWFNQSVKSTASPTFSGINGDGSNTLLLSNNGAAATLTSTTTVNLSGGTTGTVDMVTSKTATAGAVRMRALGASSTAQIISATGTLIEVGTKATISRFLTNSNNWSNDQGLQLGWAYTLNAGDSDLVNHRGAGLVGGFNFYDTTNGSSLTKIFGITGSGVVSITDGTNTTTMTPSASDLNISNNIVSLKHTISINNTATGFGPSLYLNQSGSGDSGLTFDLNGASTYSIGIDNSDSDRFKISKSATIGTVDYITLSTGGLLGISDGTNTTTLTPSANLLTINTPISVTGPGSATNAVNNLASFNSGTATAGNMYAINIEKTGAAALMIGINKNSATFAIPSNTCFISTYSVSQSLYIGRGANNGQPATGDVQLSNGQVLLEQTGDAHGTNRFYLQNRVGANGAILEQAGSFDLCSFQIKSLTNVGTITVESRPGGVYVSVPEMQFSLSSLAANAPFVIATTAVLTRVPLRISDGTNTTTATASSGLLTFNTAIRATSVSGDGSNTFLLSNTGAATTVTSTTQVNISGGTTAPIDIITSVNSANAIRLRAIGGGSANIAMTSSSGQYSFSDGANSINFSTSVGAINASSAMIFGTNGSTSGVTISTAQAVRFHAYGAGALVTDASGNITASSDERLKENITPFLSGLDSIIGMVQDKALITYQWNEESGLDRDHFYSGFSAQKIKEHLPEAIFLNKNGYYTLQDRPIIAALVNAVAELNQKIQQLQ